MGGRVMINLWKFVESVSGKTTGSSTNWIFWKYKRRGQQEFRPNHQPFVAGSEDWMKLLGHVGPNGNYCM